MQGYSIGLTGLIVLLIGEDMMEQLIRGHVIPLKGFLVKVMK